VLHVVTTNNTEVFRHLGARALQSGGVDHTVAVDYASALELIRTKVPQVAIIDVDLPGGDGYALCRELKNDLATADVCVILVLSSILTREQLDALEECGCDDVLALPIESDAFHQHLVRAAGLPYRRHARVAVDILVEVDRGVEEARLLHQLEATADDPLPEPITGSCTDLSITGAGIEVRGALKAREQVLLTLRSNREVLPPILSTVAWTRTGPNNTRAGLTFVEVPIEARLFIEQVCLFDVSPLPGGEGVEVRLRGDLTEGVNLDPLIHRLAEEQTIEIHTREVRYLSSVGLRHWCSLMGTLEGKTIRFRQLSLAFATQLAMVPMAAGDAEIVSFEAPYYCEHCDIDQIRLLDVGTVLFEDDSVTPPTLACGKCKGELVFDDVPNRYFSFLQREPGA
jgi:CheY-like chemotaxis protein